MDRRRFLRLAGGGALAAGAGVLTGCGGSLKTAGGGNAGGQDLTQAQVFGALEATRAFLDSVTVTDRDDLHGRLLDFLRSRSEFLHAGQTEDSVWAVFRNGIPYVIFTNRGLTPGEAELDPDEQDAVSGRAAGYEVPRGTLAARLCNAMGPGFKDEPAIIGGVLNRRNYVVTRQAAQIESLRSIGRPAVFYYSGHGGRCDIPRLDAQGKMIFGPDNLPLMEASFGLSTATPYDEAADNRYRSEILAGLLSAATCVEDIRNNRYVWADRFLITSRWVRRYWSFSDDSLVWISACSSANAEAGSLMAACKAKGAGMYVGWSDWVEGPHAVAVSKFVIDRLLGTNVLAPVESPRQRPFSYTEVYDDLRRRGLHARPTLDPTTSRPNGRTTQIIFSGSAGGQFGLLAPSIQFVRVDEENDEAVLTGIFGEPAPDERAVLIGGLEASVIEWTKDKVRVRLPRTGAGSSGNVEVQVRAHRSNVRRITEWNLTLRHRFRAPETPELKVEGPVRVRFRADVGEYRESPGARPKKAVRYAMLTRDSGATLTASGTRREGDCTTTWFGQSEVPPYGYEQGNPPNPGLTHMVKIDGVDRKLSLGLGLGAFPPLPWKVRVVCPSGDATNDLAPAFGLLMEIVEYGQPMDESLPGVVLPSLVLPLNAAWGISAGVFEGDEGLVRLEWDAANPTSPPDPDAARSARA